MKKQNVVVSAISYVMGSFFIQGLRFLTLPFFSRIMSTSEYALMSSYEAWVSVITILVGVQASSTINNAYLDYGTDKIKKYVSDIASLGIASAVIVSLVTLVGGGLFTRMFELDVVYLILGVVQCLFTYYLTLLITSYRIMDKVVGYLAFSIINSVVSIGIGMLLVWLLPSDKYVGRVYASLIAAILVGGVACVVIYREGRSFFHKEYVQYAMHLSIPLVFHAFGGIILSKADQIMLLKLSGRPTMGIYSYGTNFAHIIYVLGNACNLAYCPYYYSQKNQQKEEKIVRINKVYITLYCLGISAVLLVFPEIIRFMSGTEYYDAIYSAPLLAVGFMINFLYTFPVNFEFYHKKTKYIAYATGVTAALNIVFNYILIPQFGGIGAAAATLIATVFQFVIHYIVARKVVGAYEMKLGTFLWAFAGIALLTVVYYLFVELWMIRFVLTAILLLLCGLCAWKNRTILK